MQSRASLPVPTGEDATRRTRLGHAAQGCRGCVFHWVNSMRVRR